MVEETIRSLSCAVPHENTSDRGVLGDLRGSGVIMVDRMI